MEQIAPLCNRRVKKVEHSSHTKVVVSPENVTLRVGRGNLLNLTKEGLKSLETFTGVPKAFEKALSADSFGRLATELLDRKETYDVITLENEVVGFDKHMPHRCLDAERVLKAIESGITGDVEYHKAHLMGNTVKLEILGADQKPVIKNDLVRAGAFIKFSPIGEVQPTVQSFVCRLVCTNGMVSTDFLQEFSYIGGEGDNIWQWFRQNVRTAYNGYTHLVDRYQEMANEKIKPADVPMLLAQLLKEAGIRSGSAIAEGIHAEIHANPPRNTWELIQPITFAYSHLMEDGAQIERAQNTIAKFTGQEGSHARTCPTCRRQELNFN